MLDKAERETVKDIPPCFCRLVRTLLLTAVRRTEAAKASWLEIEYLNRNDYQGEALTIPAARMKGKQDHAVPLTPRVFAGKHDRVSQPPLPGGNPKDRPSRRILAPAPCRGDKGVVDWEPGTHGPPTARGPSTWNCASSS